MTRTSLDTPRQDGSHPGGPFPTATTGTSPDAPRQDGDSHPTRIGERPGSRRGAGPPPVGSVDREKIDGTTLLAPPDPAALADPYRRYARLRAEDPVHRTRGGLWILTRHAEVAAVLRDPRFGREGFELYFGMGGASTAPGADPRFGREGFERHFGASSKSTPSGDGLARAACPGTGGHRQSMLFRDPPHHTRLRDAVSHAFTPRAVEALRPRVQAHVEYLLDRAATAGRMDVVADLAEPLSRAVVGELLGIPVFRRRAFADWSAAVARSLDALPIPEDRPLVAEGEAARRALGGYVRLLVAKHRDPIWSKSRIADMPQSVARRVGRWSDLTRALVEAADEDGLLTDSELVAMIVLLLVAGTETTVSSIATTVRALLAHPGELRRLREAPWLLPAAVEEALRWESPVQRTWRIAREDVALGPHTIPRGALVVLLLGAANRDPARFADPDRFDVLRRDLGHVAFGAGVHHCLGAALARLETQVAVGALLRRWPSLRLATDRPAWRPTATVRSLATLPVTW